jgi:glycosyltransferase involved in cell wall biosynthesis
MKVLIALTYYRPHVSGLTIYVQRLAKALAAKGQSVTVLTSRYDRALPQHETEDGVEIRRVPVSLRVSKGVLMPTFGLEATRQVLKHDAISLHLPQLDAAGIALRGRLFGRPTVLTYHCDLLLPGGVVNAVANIAANAANHIAARFADKIVAYTEDYATHSPFLSRYLNKIEVIEPPVEIPNPGAEALNRIRTSLPEHAGPVIGMAARLATEKGVEYLVQALVHILERHPNAHVLFAGQYEDVMGEQAYANRLAPALAGVKNHWTFLGVLKPEEMAAFYQLCDVTVLPSINSTESFGLVQIESMICGTAVVASNLPGVRQPVRMTGMGTITPLRDAPVLAEKIMQVVSQPQEFQADSAVIAERFSPKQTAARYLDLFQRLLSGANKE